MCVCCVYACEHGCVRERVHVNDSVRASRYVRAVSVYVPVCMYLCVRMCVCMCVVSACMHSCMFLQVSQSACSLCVQVEFVWFI